jgi:DNA-binding transcriptional regulator YdaS (Cro superfamily)
MEFKNYYKSLNPDEKKGLAEKLDTSVCQLSQLANGHKKAGAKFLLAIFDATNGEITPQQLRPN